MIKHMKLNEIPNEIPPALIVAAVENCPSNEVSPCDHRRILGKEAEKLFTVYVFGMIILLDTIYLIKFSIKKGQSYVETLQRSFLIFKKLQFCQTMTSSERFIIKPVEKNLAVALSIYCAHCPSLC